MKKLNIFLAGLLILSSCVNEIDNEPVIRPDAEGEVTLRMQVPGLKKPVVYAATEVEENAIAELDILAFAKKTALIDTLVYRMKVESSGITDVSGAVNGNQKDIKVKLQRTDSDLRIVLIANARSVLDGVSVKSGDALSDVFEKLVYGFSGKWNTNPMTGIPMWGQTSNYISVKNPVVTDPVNITLLRSVAKVDIGIDIYGDPSIGLGTRFKLKHVYVYNAKNKGFIVPDLTDSGLTSNKVTKPNVPSGAQALNSFQEYAMPAGTNKFYNEIYLPESEKTDAEHTCLIIGGIYDEGRETYYRIDFLNNQDQRLDLLRNYRFLVNITNVARDGFATKEEAAKAKTSHVEYSLSVFNEDINSIVYNGQYGLGVSQNKIKLGWNASTGNTLVVATDYLEGFTVSSDDGWINITSAPTGVMNGNVVFDVSRNNTEALFREGKIKITAGSLEQEVIVRQSLGANSFIVKPGGSVQVPVLFANADGVKRVTEAMSFDAEVVWQDAAGLITNVAVDASGKDAIMSITAKRASGNAVVALKSGNTILWSWHIWVTSYDPDSITSQKSYKGTEFMDRNLGAVSDIQDAVGTLGLYYQWGRKDPFPGPSSTSSNVERMIVDGVGDETVINQVKVVDAANFDNTIKNPMTFYFSEEFPWYSWYGLEAVNNSLWIDPQGKKTAYDPCPAGWRVPVNPDVWNGVSIANWRNGALLSSVGYYPATGSRDFSSGRILDVGNDAYYWTAATSGVKAKAMRISSANISIQATPLRASGYPVRCVKE